MRAEAHKTRGRGDAPEACPAHSVLVPPTTRPSPAHHSPSPADRRRHRPRLPPRRAAAQRLLPVMHRIAASGELPKVPPFWF